MGKYTISIITCAKTALFIILPAALRQIELCDDAGIEELTAEVRGLTEDFVAALKVLEKANASHPHSGSAIKHAEYMRDKVLPAMDAVREVADSLEGIVADDLWPLPKYQEMLFVK